MARFLSSLESFLFDNNLTNDGKVYGFLPLIGPALPVILIDIAYVVFVLKVGPKFMASRRGYDLSSILKYYNILQVLLNLYVAVISIYKIATEEDLDISCMNQLPVGHRTKLFEVQLFYLGYINKFLDYFDTIFFVLRKSYRQVNFLHIYHHLMMTTCIYVYIRYYGFGGHASIIGVVNSLVHAVMYSYYLLTVARPALKQSIWFKRHITELQLLQFCLLFVHQAWPLMFRPDCAYPTKWIILAMIQAIVMVIMFSNFYRKTYMKSSGGRKNVEAKTSNKIH